MFVQFTSNQYTVPLRVSNVTEMPYNRSQESVHDEC